MPARVVLEADVSKGLAPEFKKFKKLPKSLPIGPRRRLHERGTGDITIRRVRDVAKGDISQGDTREVVANACGAMADI
eukprot:7810182-Alexandrium_andersonii.AAC.1